jgi:hypothetical protein
MKCKECKFRLINQRDIGVCYKTSYQLLDSMETHPKCPFPNEEDTSNKNRKKYEIMKKVKLSELSKDTIVLAYGNSNINTVQDILEDLEGFKNKAIYTTKEYKASFDAKNIIDDAIENEYNNGMYEDWDDSIKADVTEEDITDLQNIFDRILSRNPSSNIAYDSDKLIEIDM